MFDIRQDGENRISLAGRFDASQVETAAAVLNKLTASTTVDLSGLEYISSAGLGVFISAHQLLAKQGEKLTLTGMNEHVRHVFQLARLHLVLHLE